MTTGYLAEISTDKGTFYIGPANKLRKHPYFHGGMMLKKLLERGRYSKDCLNGSDLAIQITEVKKLGLKASFATRMSVYEFNKLPFGMKKVPPTPPNAVYKIELFTPIGPFERTQKFIGTGKFGKSWDAAGAVRLHITANIEKLMGTYAKATVLEIFMLPDGVTPKMIIRHPILDFYKMSPDSAKRYSEHQFKGTLDEVSDNFYQIGNKQL
jgi:hypothetical protein